MEQWETVREGNRGGGGGGGGGEGGGKCITFKLFSPSACPGSRRGGGREGSPGGILAEFGTPHQQLARETLDSL